MLLSLSKEDVDSFAVTTGCFVFTVLCLLEVVAFASDFLASVLKAFFMKLNVEDDLLLLELWRTMAG